MFVIHYKCLLKACIKYLKNVPIGTHLFLMVYDSLNNTNFASYENPQDAASAVPELANDELS
jgi:hypothetical protein